MNREPVEIIPIAIPILIEVVAVVLIIAGLAVWAMVFA